MVRGRQVIWLSWHNLYGQLAMIYIRRAPGGGGVCRILLNPQHEENFILLFYLDIDDCSPNSCQNDGSCIDGIADFTCNCSDGFAGNTCEISNYFLTMHMKVFEQDQNFFSINDRKQTISLIIFILKTFLQILMNALQTLVKMAEVVLIK